MATKPQKVQGAGVAFYFDGGIQSRLQSATIDTDLGVENIEEISNSEIVEFVEGLPTVTLTFEANQWGKRDNIAAVTGMDGSIQKGFVSGDMGVWQIDHRSFDGTSVDIVAHVEEDSALARSMYVGGAFVTSVGYNFDVGGVSTESYTLEADNKVWYFNTYKEIMVCSGYYDSGTLASGVYVRPHPNLCNDAGGTNYMLRSGFSEAGTDINLAWTPLFITIDGDKITDANGDVVVPKGGEIYDDDWVVSYNNDSLFSTGRIRVVGYRDTDASTTITDVDATSSSTIGGIRKGMIELFLVSGSMYGGETGRGIYTDVQKREMLRLQTCSIDVDLSRESLEQLGDYKAFTRSLNYPITATVNFSALASDLELWCGFSDKTVGYLDYLGGGSDISEVQFRDFVQNQGVLIKIYDDDETNVNRNHLMTLTVSGVRVASESFSVDAGGNAVQEFSCTADNFVVS